MGSGSLENNLTLRDVFLYQLLFLVGIILSPISLVGGLVISMIHLTSSLMKRNLPMMEAFRQCEGNFLLAWVPFAGNAWLWGLGIAKLVRISYESLGILPPIWADRHGRIRRGGGIRRHHSPDPIGGDRGLSNLTDTNRLIIGSRGQYQYRPLLDEHEVRLLTIYPGSIDDPICGDLETASLLRRPPYDALSYTWADETGNADREKEITCVESGGKIRITRNCEDAMRRLRLPGTKRRVWIDAVCIDQDSNRDRNHQVSLMSRIYMSARQVVLYTGEGTAKTDLLFDWLNSLREDELEASLKWQFDDIRGEIGTALERYWNMGQAILRSPATSESNITLSEMELVELVKDYFSRRWFKRVWVLQEAALPDMKNTTIICGDKSTPASRALHALFLLRNSTSGSMIRIFVLLRKRSRDISHSHLLDILIETRDREATDPRDKIFGVLSIAHGLDGGKFPELMADYGKATHEVYTYYSAFFILHHGPGLFLSLIKSRGSMSELLPSWAADWTVSWPNYKAVSGRDFAAARRSVGDKDSGAEFHDEGGSKVLTVVRPRIFRGYFTRDGHVDDSNSLTTEDVEHIGDDMVLIEMYHGLAALLMRDRGDYTFIQVCPHALSQAGVEELVGRWSSVVVDAKGPEDVTGRDSQSPLYLGAPETFKIR
jgi:hypothetical protein